MNKVEQIGRITRDLDLRKTPDGKSVISFTIAVPRRNRQEADFISCTAWEKTAETIYRYFKKGQRIGIVGHLHSSSYESNGHKVYRTDVVVEEFFFIERKEADMQESFDPDLPF